MDMTTLRAASSPTCQITHQVSSSPFDFLETVSLWLSVSLSPTCKHVMSVKTGDLSAAGTGSSSTPNDEG